MNLNALAKSITLAEGGAQSLSIAQVKEVLRCALDELSITDPVDVLVMLRKHRDRKPARRRRRH